MSRLCKRPGCSELGAAEYGMVPEDLLFWIAPLTATMFDDQNVLCLRHADAMSVPRGWTLDDRREEIPRLFKPPTAPATALRTRQSRARHPRADRPAVEQLQIDGTGEIERPELPVDPIDESGSWRPDFDSHDDLDGLLEVSSPLLARAFRGTDRPRP